MTADIVSTRNLLVLIMSVHCHSCSLNLLSVRWLLHWAALSLICQLVVAAHHGCLCLRFCIRWWHVSGAPLAVQRYRSNVTTVFKDVPYFWHKNT